MKIGQSLLLLFFLLTGCVSTDVVTFDSMKRPPTAESQVLVLLEKPERPHSVIARIQVGPDAFVSDYQGQTREVVRRSAEMGADAVIVTYDSRVSGYVGGSATAGFYGGTSESNFTVGLAIVFDNR